MSQVAHMLGVSPVTARRYIRQLAAAGKLQKIRNGCTKIAANNFHEWSSFNINTSHNYEEKRRIAMAAAALCDDGDSVIINCGSTAFLLGQEICGKNIRVVTNYFPLLKFLIEHHVRGATIVIGGQFYPEKNLFITNDLHHNQIYAGKYMFTSGSGLTEQGLFKSDLLSLLAEQKLIPQVQKLVCLVDSEKIGSRQGQLFVPAPNIDILITGKNADPRVIAALKVQGVEVITV
ncbi:HTH-type transcriptional regulator UlaR [Psittacicella hinzii]|uniref:HTH-type transcriptional regulator UlaR n=1 Tax=Psittacicella hinzii TaxID=2028575 RepID=UPI002482652B|nr:HTH-type transcriptional regulator UlaR [Psittacicella hinzii]